MTRVFVDGASGTVGMALAPHLVKLHEAGLILGPSELMRTPDCRPEEHRALREARMAWADLVVVCLPDEAAVESVARIRELNPTARILDASAAHRCAEGWVYGLPEVTAAADIANAQFVANPGCFATGCILLARPLLPSLGPEGLRPWLPFQGMTGYSAAGKRGRADASMPRLTQFGAEHRHLPEIERYAGVAPVLTTAVGPWHQGMLVQATVPLDVHEVVSAYQAWYAENPDVTVEVADATHSRLSATEMNGTNKVRILVAAQPYGGTTVAAVYDNLGKGSAGAAAFNLKLMLEGCVPS